VPEPSMRAVRVLPESLSWVMAALLSAGVVTLVFFPARTLCSFSLRFPGVCISTVPSLTVVWILEPPVGFMDIWMTMRCRGSPR